MDKLSVVAREITNKRVNRNLRKEGKVPAVVYGVDGVHHILLDSCEFMKKFGHFTDNTVLLLADEASKTERCVFVQAMQNDLVKDMIIHLDFLEVDPKVSLKRMIPLTLNGAAPGVKDGGTLVHTVKEISIDAKPADIPVLIEVSIAELNIGQGVKVKDLKLGKGVTILNDADQDIVLVK